MYFHTQSALEEKQQEVNGTNNLQKGCGTVLLTFKVQTY